MDGAAPPTRRQPMVSTIRPVGRRAYRWVAAVAMATLALLGACGTGAPARVAAQSAVDVGTVATADPGSALPGDWTRGAFIEIYVRGYKDSDGDGIGDLRGLIQSLDYLRDLGVTGIWLLPVNASQDHDHGYAVTDYRAIEAEYGGLADFDLLLREAHARGIGVIIDYVINHSAADHPLFVNSRAARDNPYRSWYVWEPNAPAGWSIYGRDPWHPTQNGAYFAAFSDRMPEFDLRNPQVVRYHHDNLRFWLNRGVDGFRFDAVGNLVENGPSAWENQPENLALMQQVRALVMGYANRYLVCESPAAPQLHGSDRSCGGSFAFGQHADIVAATAGDAAALARVAQYFVAAPAGMASFVSNHDAFAGDRLWDQVGGDAARVRLAAATYLLLPGTPFVYYGEEIGMSGGAGLVGDHRLRTPMSWTADSATGGFTSGTPFRALSANVATNNVASEAQDPESLLSFYRAMIGLRKSRQSLLRGGYEPEASGRVMSFRRTLADEQTLVIINFGDGDATAALTRLPAAARLQRLWPKGGRDAAADAHGESRIVIAKRSLTVFDVRRGP